MIGLATAELLHAPLKSVNAVEKELWLLSKVRVGNRIRWLGSYDSCQLCTFITFLAMHERNSYAVHEIRCNRSIMASRVEGACVGKS